MATDNDTNPAPSPVEEKQLQTQSNNETTSFIISDSDPFAQKYADWEAQHGKQELEYCVCQNPIDCPYVQRIFHCIKYYQTLNISKDTVNSYKSKIEPFFRKSYQMFMPDIEHTIKCHDSVRQQIFESMMKNHDDINICNPGECQFIQRMLELIKGEHWLDDRFEFYRDLYDAIHIYFFHLNANDANITMPTKKFKKEAEYRYIRSDFTKKCDNWYSGGNPVFNVKDAFIQKLNKSILFRIDYALSQYFIAFGRKYYVDNTGLFEKFCNDYSIESDQIKSELMAVWKDSVFESFEDENGIFPLPGDIDIDDQEQRGKRMLEVLRHCGRFGIAPIVKVSEYEASDAPRLNVIARVVLCGVYDDDNIWSNLRGMRYIVRDIIKMANDWDRLIDKTGLILYILVFIF